MQYVVFDLEATCWQEKPQGAISEIIEIGAVKLDGCCNQVDAFDTFVRPTAHPVLSGFCTQLTSISQADVDGAEPFTPSMDRFAAWIGDMPTTLLSWGHYDKKQLLAESRDRGYRGSILAMLEQHRSLKHDFAAIRRIRPCGMKRALEMLDIPLKGIHHRGIDDACNIARIFQAVHKDWLAYIAEQ